MWSESYSANGRCKLLSSKCWQAFNSRCYNADRNHKHLFLDPILSCNSTQILHPTDIQKLNPNTIILFIITTIFKTKMWQLEMKEDKSSKELHPVFREKSRRIKEESLWMYIGGQKMQQKCLPSGKVDLRWEERNAALRCDPSRPRLLFASALPLPLPV